MLTNFEYFSIFMCIFITCDLDVRQVECAVLGLCGNLNQTLSMQALTSMLQGQDGIPPRMFKSLIGTGHPEFASSRQQVYFGTLIYRSIDLC